MEQVPAIPFLERQALFGLVKQGTVMFLDIREPDEFAAAHLPAARNVPFSTLQTSLRSLQVDATTTVVPYCNWDFRAYVAAVELQRRGVPRVAMMYPHGLRGWIASGLPVASEGHGQTDAHAWAQFMETIRRSPVMLDTEPRATDKRSGRTTTVNMRILPRRVEPAHIRATVGDRVVLELTAEEEDHWFVIPDFGVDVHLAKGERRTVTLEITRSGYFPLGCISCCTRYRCQTKQAIVVDLTTTVASYGE